MMRIIIKKIRLALQPALSFFVVSCLFSNGFGSNFGNLFSGDLNSSGVDSLFNHLLSGKGVNDFFSCIVVVASCKGKHAGDSHKEHYFLHLFGFLKLSILGY